MLTEVWLREVYHVLFCDLANQGSDSDSSEFIRVYLGPLFLRYGGGQANLEVVWELAGG